MVAQKRDEQVGLYGRQSRGNEKSIQEQFAAGEAVCEEEQWTLAHKLQDGTSASRYARKKRDDWQSVLELIRRGELSILMLWESSRGDRTLTSWSAMLDLCRESGVRIYVISHERLYDPRKHRDWKSLAEDGVSSAVESDLISVRVRRGQAGAAKQGNPRHGPPSTGYVRIYNSRTGKLLRDEPDDLHCPLRQMLDGDETTYDTSYRGEALPCPSCTVWHYADIVREVIHRVAKAVPITALERDFDRRGVPTLNGAGRWYRQRFRDIATNHAYIGERLYSGNLTAGQWLALVDADTFYAAKRVLSDPIRLKSRPGRGKHLLSHIAAAPCGSVLQVVGDLRYRCAADGCVTILKEPTDRFVEELIFARVTNPDVYLKLRQAGDNSDREAAEARDEVARLDGKLATWRQAAIAGTTSPESLAVIEADLVRQRDLANVRADRAQIPPVLRDLLEPGVDVRGRWESMGRPAQRDIVRALAVIVVGPASVPGRRGWERERLAGSRWVGAAQTWGEIWADD